MKKGTRKSLRNPKNKSGTLQQNQENKQLTSENQQVSLKSHQKSQFNQIPHLSQTKNIYPQDENDIDKFLDDCLKTQKGQSQFYIKNPKRNSDHNPQKYDKQSIEIKEQSQFPQSIFIKSSIDNGLEQNNLQIFQRKLDKESPFFKGITPRSQQVITTKFEDISAYQNIQPPKKDLMEQLVENQRNSQSVAQLSSENDSRKQKIQKNLQNSKKNKKKKLSPEKESYIDFSFKRQKSNPQSLISQRAHLFPTQVLQKTNLNLQKSCRLLKAFQNGLMSVMNYHRLKEQNIELFNYQENIFNLLRQQSRKLAQLLTEKKGICSKTLNQKNKQKYMQVFLLFKVM